jgi:hypothetical protein
MLSKLMKRIYYFFAAVVPPPLLVCRLAMSSGVPTSSAVVGMPPCPAAWRTNNLPSIAVLQGKDYFEVRNMTIMLPYYEEQRFTRKWILVVQYLLLLLFAGIGFLLVFQQKTGVLIAVMPFGLVCLIVALFRMVRLQVQIGEDEIRYRFYPFHRRFRVIKKAEVSSISVRTYDALGEYGGQGIRYGRKGMAYTITGNYGIGIIMGTGKEILLGTGQPEKVAAALKQYHWI